MGWFSYNEAKRRIATVDITNDLRGQVADWLLTAVSYTGWNETRHMPGWTKPDPTSIWRVSHGFVQHFQGRRVGTFPQMMQAYHAADNTRFERIMVDLGDLVLSKDIRETKIPATEQNALKFQRLGEDEVFRKVYILKTIEWYWKPLVPYFVRYGYTKAVSAQVMFDACIQYGEGNVVSQLNALGDYGDELDRLAAFALFFDTKNPKYPSTRRRDIQAKGSTEQINPAKYLFPTSNQSPSVAQPPLPPGMNQASGGAALIGTAIVIGGIVVGYRFLG